MSSRGDYNIISKMNANSESVSTGMSPARAVG